MPEKRGRYIIPIKKYKRKRYHYLVQATCARCGKRWTPTCCDYSYKALEASINRQDITTAQRKGLLKIWKKRFGSDYR